MSNWALINNGIVIYVVQQDTQPVFPPYTVVNVDDQPQVSPNWTYDGTAFSAPVPVSTWIITSLSLKNRWPQSAWSAMLQAVTTDPVIANFENSLSLALYVNLKDPSLAAAIQYLQGSSIPADYQLTSVQATAILDTPAAIYEIPPGFPGFNPNAITPIPSLETP
jgi:hypothetical protein